jgi:hypothetical protein
MMWRREFITLLGSAVLAWPYAAHGQQADSARHIGFLSVIHESDPEAQGWIKEFKQRLQELGWADGRNIRMCTLPIRSQLASSRIWRGRRATSPASPISSFRSAGSGCSSSRTAHLPSAELRWLLPRST